MAEWAFAIVREKLPELGSNVCNAWWLQAPRLIDVVASALFALVLALSWLHSFLGNTPVDLTSNSTNSARRCSSRTLRLIASCTGALAYASVATWEDVHSPHDGIELGFYLAQCFTWLAFTAICILEIRGPRSTTFRGLTRAWWTIALVLAACETTALLIQRVWKNCHNEVSMVALAAAMVNLVASVVLVGSALLEGPGKSSNSTHLNGSLNGSSSVDATEPLLEKQQYVGYAGASRLSRLTWQWMNPLLQKGYNSRLEVADVPNLAPADDTERFFERYEESWSKSEGTNKVRSTLIRAFKRELLKTGALALGRACVMYIGPTLITRFVDFKAADTGLWPGIGLVTVLVVAKTLDVTASHHFNFQCTNLGMAIRSTLITVVYRKGIRLTNAARMVHGVGQIVNYMSVDVQTLSDVILQVHYLWLLPIQVGIALTILYSVVGWSMLAGFLTMVGIVCLSTWSSKMQRKYQGLIMKARDLRMKATSESLNAMKVIKLQGWETHFQDHIEKLRGEEFQWILQFMYQVLSTTSFIWCAPIIVSVATFACCLFLEGIELTPGQVFTAVATFRILQEPIRNFPQTLISVSQAIVSLERLEKYLRSEELDLNAVERGPIDGNLAVAVRSASFTWTESDGSGDENSSSLRDINLEVKEGALVAVVGTVGSGKSSLLACILGEMPKLEGKVCVSGSTAYVPQGAWIQSGTIEDNILFGQPMDRRRYSETVRICALERDMELFEQGDQTEIGERGINLSGGQKQRIQLARAVYQDCDVYLLDDIFSAVDAHTGSAIFQDCVLGVLKNKTVILVTHQIDFLHQADCILVMQDGKIAQSGKYDDLVTPGTALEKLVIAHNDSMQLVEKPDFAERLFLEEPETSYEPAASLERISSVKETRPLPNARNQSAKQGSAKLVEEEQREIGQVSRSIYWLYLTKAFGPRLIVALLVVQTLWQTCMVSSDYWLAHETSARQQGSLNRVRFIRVYALLGLGSWVCVFARTSLIVVLGVNTTQLFFLQMLRCIFRAPMAFFDTTPSGRILSRASSDQATLDIWLAFFYGAALAIYFSLFGAIVVMCQTAWPIIFVMIPLAYVYFLYQAYFIASSRELTRMDSITKAPIIHHFSESIAGFMVIRCFQKEQEFSRANVDRVNQNIRMVFHNNGATEWLGFRLEMIGTIVLCSLAFLLVVLPARLAPPQLVGLALSYGLSLNVLLYWTVWLACQLENKMVSVERIHQFTKILPEAPLVVPECRPAADWPSSGTIEIKNLQLRYRVGTPLVLKGITLKILGGEKVGVVGRTGSGKSTLIQALFRVVEASAGQIVIDGVDISRLGLSDLRSKFGIIPQEPTLFEGTVRANIDPIGVYSDNEIWECLRACQLDEIVRGKPEKLDSLVADDGDNWSVGQKQLFCLGRALLKRAKILVLDEATASVDAHTDSLIQKTVQEAFSGSTVISIAHRIPTVMNSDKVLVLDAGRVKEYDTPSRLLDGSTPSLFAALVKEYSTRGHHDVV